MNEAQRREHCKKCVNHKDYIRWTPWSLIDCDAKKSHTELYGYKTYWLHCSEYREV